MDSHQKEFWSKPENKYVYKTSIYVIIMLLKVPKSFIENRLKFF